MNFPDYFSNYRPTRPTIRSVGGAVSAGNYLAAEAGVRMLRCGGNAVDAGVAAGLCLNVVHNDMCSLSGVAPIILYNAHSKTVFSIAGVGPYGRHVDVDALRNKYTDRRMEWPDNTVVPAALDAWVTALRDHGTLPLETVGQPALECARAGHPVSPFQHRAITVFLDTYRRFSENRRIFLRHGEAPQIGERIEQPDLADTLEKLLQVERENHERGREAALTSVRDYFYKGPLGEKLVAFGRSEGSALTMDDFSTHQVRYEKPYTVEFGDLEIYGCGPWSQGPVLLQALRILGTYEAEFLSRGAEDAIHTIIESLKLAFWDRHTYYGDPRFVDVPMERLLGAGYAKEKAEQIGHRSGRYGTGRSESSTGASPGPTGGAADTSYVAAMDAAGNIFSATPSDGYSQGGICPGLGLHISERGAQGAFDPEDPNCIAPLKRPRLTPNPCLVLKGGKPYMAFGTPGNDRQPQAMLQVLLNMELFGMEPQKAIEMPRFASYDFPAATHPHTAVPNMLQVEKNYPRPLREDLAERGHDIKQWPTRHWSAGGVCVVRYNDRLRCFESGADFRRDGYAIGV